MITKRVDLDDNKELIVRTKEELSTNRFHRRKFKSSIKEVIINTGEDWLCIGICENDVLTGVDEFIRYTSQCVIFFKGSMITRQYSVERVFDVATMQSLVLTKEEIKEKYDFDIPEEIKDPIEKNKENRLAKTLVGNETK